MARILFADDDLFYRKLVTNSIAEMGHEVTAVADGNQALQEWQKAEPPYACLVFDVHMAGMSGLELLIKIKELTAIKDERRRRVPIIIMTSDEKIQAEVTARRERAFSFLVKPFSEKQLEKAVSKALALLDHN